MLVHKYLLAIFGCQCNVVEVIRCVRYVTFVLVNMAALVGNRWQGAGGRACAGRPCSSHLVSEVRADALPVQSGCRRIARLNLCRGHHVCDTLSWQRSLSLVPFSVDKAVITCYCASETSKLGVNRLDAANRRGASTWQTL